MSNPRKEISLNPENVSSSEEYERELAKTTLDDIEKDYRQSMLELTQEMRSNKDMDLMSKLSEMKMIENIQKTYEVLKNSNAGSRHIERAYDFLIQLKSLQDFRLLKIVRERFMPNEVKTAIAKDKRGKMKALIKSIMPMVRRRLEQNKNYTYMDPANLPAYLKNALPEGRKHYAYPFMLCLLYTALNYNLGKCSTFLTQTFINIKNLVFQPDKHPEILTSIIKFCEKEFNYQPSETAITPDNVNPEDKKEPERTEGPEPINLATSDNNE